MKRPPTKDDLKKQLELWAIRQHDAKNAAVAWRMAAVGYLTEPCAEERRDRKANDTLVHLALIAFVASYGRLFTGNLGLELKAPWVLAEDIAVHEHIMQARHGAVAHSSRELRRVRLVPPGAEYDGRVVTPAVAVDDWRWLVTSLALKADAGHVDRIVARIHDECAERASQALRRLLESCRDHVIATTITPLDEF